MTVTARSYSEARDHLPECTVWSCSFGYQGEAGFCEYWRDEDGSRWIITNGDWTFGFTPEWTVTRQPTEGN